MSNITTGTSLGNALDQLMGSAEIIPGDEPSYQLCKIIYTHHPLGAKMAESPINMAQAQEREITVPNSPEERVRERFLFGWKELMADRHIFNAMRLSRVYGVSTLGMMVEGVPPRQPVKYENLPELNIQFNEWDPLNTAGSIVLNQDPNAADFQKKVSPVVVNGTAYHPSRTVVILNEDPIYIWYTSSSFGYVGRSVYQRAVFPLKSFIRTMITDDMVARKAGLLIAKLKQAGSTINNLMARVTGVKRNLLKMGETNEVLSVSAQDNEDVTTLNMQNIDGAGGWARKNILENIAVAADMPAMLLNQETFAEGFADGTEDAKAVARYIDRVRVQMSPLYDFFDKIVMYKYWSPAFYATIQAEFPEYKDVPYKKAFMDWKNSFKAKWPSLLTEPDSEKVKVDDVKLKAAVAILEALVPSMDPENKAAAIEWVMDNINDMKFLFTNPMILDIDALREYVPPQPAMGGEEGQEPKPKDEGSGFGRADSALARYEEASARLQAPAAARLRARQVAKIAARSGSNIYELVDHAVRSAQAAGGK
jgi:hypothetical protein